MTSRSRLVGYSVPRQGRTVAYCAVISADRAAAPRVEIGRVQIPR